MQCQLFDMFRHQSDGGQSRKRCSRRGDIPSQRKAPAANPRLRGTPRQSSGARYSKRDCGAGSMMSLSPSLRMIASSPGSSNSRWNADRPDLAAVLEQLDVRFHSHSRLLWHMPKHSRLRTHPNLQELQRRRRAPKRFPCPKLTSFKRRKSASKPRGCRIARTAKTRSRT